MEHKTFLHIIYFFLSVVARQTSHAYVCVCVCVEYVSHYFYSSLSSSPAPSLAHFSFSVCHSTLSRIIIPFLFTVVEVTFQRCRRRRRRILRSYSLPLHHSLPNFYYILYNAKNHQIFAGFDNVTIKK